jgi:hypothetical protein
VLDPALGYLIVLSFALLFAFAGGHKLRNLALFAEVFAAYRVSPDSWARRTAWLIPCVELAIVPALLWAPGRSWAVPAAAGLLIAYACALGLNLARGRRELDCGCGTVGNRRSIAPWMAWRNLLLALVLGIAALPWAARPLNGSDILTVTGGLVAMAVLYVAVDQLLGEVAPKAMALSGRTS